MYVHKYVCTYVHMYVCMYVGMHARIYVSSDCVSTDETHKDLYLTEHVQNITLFIFHSNSFIPRNINSCSTILFCTKAYKYLPDKVNYRQRQKLCK